MSENVSGKLHRRAFRHHNGGDYPDNALPCGLVNVLLMDGVDRIVSESINATTWQRLGTRSD
ncbi:MAG: hypothetical protein ACI92S_003613, partial [Planctomycetaceae bacterium]